MIGRAHFTIVAHNLVARALKVHRDGRVPAEQLHELDRPRRDLERPDPFNKKNAERRSGAATHTRWKAAAEYKQL